MTNEPRTYTKLSELVDRSFTVEQSLGFKWKRWDPEANRMLLSDKFEKGYQKKYTVLTDKGSLDLGSGQLASLLEAVFKDGRADIIGRTFAVKSNGKSGLDIRYFFNPTVAEAKDDQVHIVPDDEPVNLEDIPF